MWLLCSPVTKQTASTAGYCSLTTARTLHVTCTLEFSEATKTGLRFLKSLDTTMVMYIWFHSDFWRVRRKNDRWDERFISRKATCKRPTIAFACTRLKVWLMKTSGSFYIRNSGTCFGFGKCFVPTSHRSFASKQALDLRMCRNE